MAGENPEFARILQGEQLQFDRFATMQASTDERKFYSLDETYEAIQKRYDLRCEFFANRQNIRGSLAVLPAHQARFVYNHPKDYRFEKLSMIVVYPEVLAFSFVDPACQRSHV